MTGPRPTRLEEAFVLLRLTSADGTSTIYWAHAEGHDMEGSIATDPSYRPSLPDDPYLPWPDHRRVRIGNSQIDMNVGLRRVDDYHGGIIQAGPSPEVAAARVDVESAVLGIIGRALPAPDDAPVKD